MQIEMQLSILSFLGFGVALMHPGGCDERVRVVSGCKPEKTVIFDARRQCGCHPATRNQKTEEIWVENYRGQYRIWSSHNFEVMYTDGHSSTTAPFRKPIGWAITEPLDRNREFKIFIEPADSGQVRVDLECNP